jgi:hypothetical protein
MIQLYILSIICNVGAGYLLVTGAKRGGRDAADPASPAIDSIEDSLKFSLKNETFRLILGLLTGITGVLKFLSTIDGNFPVFGDFIPALAGLSTGLILVFDFYQAHTNVESEETRRLGGFLEKNRVIFGFFAIAAAFFHFLLPNALLL